MKKYQVKVLISSGNTYQYDEYVLENVTKFFSDSSGYYYFQTEDGLGHYFPIDKTIIRQIKTD